MDLKKVFPILLVSLLLASGFTGVLGSMESGERSFYTDHTPIRIDSDSDFSGFGFNGSGTEADPWIIENYRIDGSGYEYCIYIGNTTQHFVIQGCDLRKADDAGIGLYNITNGTIYNNTVAENSGDGIHISLSYNLTLEKNDASANGGNGTYLQNSHDIRIIDGKNTYDGGVAGIYLNSSWNNTLDNNTISTYTKTGIYLFSSENNSIANNSADGHENPGIYLKDSDNNTIWNNSIHSSYGHAFYLDSSDGNHIMNNTASTGSSGDDGIHLLRSTENIISGNNASSSEVGINLDRSDSNTILNNDLYSCRLYGINIQTSDMNHVSENTIAWCSYESILLSHSSNNSILNNSISHGRSGIYMLSEQYPSNDNIVKNNTVNDNTFGIYLEGAKRSLIDGNTVLRNSNAGIFLSVSDGSTVSNNTVSYTGQNGIYVGHSPACSILNNTVSYNDAAGIHLESSSNDVVSGNILTDNGIELFGNELSGWNTHVIDTTNAVNGKPVYYYRNQTAINTPSDAGQVIVANCSGGAIDGVNIENATTGIQIGFSDNITVSNSSFANNSDKGLYFYYSQDCAMENSSAVDSYYGVMVSYSERIIIRRNTIRDHGRGMEIDNSDNGRIFGNTISSNVEYGIYMSSSSDNIIYHNNFIDNTMNQAYDDQNNLWNSSYPEGGNYWSDYSGIDLYKGPDQNQNGQDGIGDAPYNISGGGNLDMYPLMNPWNGTLPADTEAPAVSGATPANNSLNVSVSHQIIISFSEFMDESTVTYTCSPDPDGWTASWASTVPILTLSHPDFDYNTTYTFNITGGNDLSGKALDNIPYVLVFTTEKDTYEPFLTINSPADGAILNTSYVTFNWSGGDNETGLNHYEIRLDGGTWVNVGFDTSQSYSSLSDGSHIFTVKAVDNAGNERTDTVSITVDTTNPVLTITSPSNNSFRTVSGVNIMWNGSDANLDHYEIRLDAGVWQSVGIAGGYTYTGLSDGDHTVYVVAFDTAGNKNTSSVHFFVDTLIPDVVITSPESGHLFNVSAVTVTWNGWDNGSSGIEHYEFSQDGGFVWIDVGMNTSYTATGLKDGNRTLWVMAFDRAGNWKKANLSVVIDTTSPTVVISAPANGAPLNMADITVSWAVSGSYNHSEVKMDSGSWVDAGKNQSMSFTGLSEGEHTVRIRAVDDAGNWNYTQSVFYVDLTGPYGVSPTYPVNIALNEREINFTWSAGSDNISGIDHYDISIDGSSWKGAGSTPWYASMLSMNDGEHTFSIRATDRAGNQFTTAVASFSIDCMPPSLTVYNPTANGFWNESEMLINWTGHDDSYAGDGGSRIEHYEVSVNGGEPINVGLNTSYIITGMQDGLFEISVTVFDGAGNYASDAFSITVDTVSPVVEITVPSESGFTTGFPQLWVNWTGNDEGSGIQRYELRVDGGEWMDMGTRTSEYLTSSDGLEAVSGEHTVEVRAFDRAGNMASTDSVSFFFDLDAPVILDYSPQGSDVSTDAVISISFSEPMGRIYFTVGGDSHHDGNISWDGNTATFTPDRPFAHGEEVSVFVSADDAHGNSVIFNWSFTVTSEGAGPRDVEVSGTVVDSDGNPVAGAEIVYDGYVVGSTDENGHFTIVIPEGVQTITVVSGEQRDTFEVNAEYPSTDAGTVSVDLAPGESTDSSGNYALIAIIVLLLIGAVAFMVMKGRKKPSEEGVADESAEDETEETEYVEEEPEIEDELEEL